MSGDRKALKYLSICSGMEAASVAFHPFGWQALAFAEIEAFPSALLAHHYPAVPNLGDMTRFREWPEDLLAECDLLVGGPPCQAFSVAGARNSLDDARGNLTLTYVQLIDHIDTIRRKHGRPPILSLYENVPGIYSTKDNAFGCLVGAICGQDAPVETETGKWPTSGIFWGTKRRVGYRTLDAQYFGLAQRRRRCFLLAVPNELVERLGDRACPSEILSIPESLRGDTPPCRGQREDIAATLEASAGRSRGAGTPHSMIAPPLTSNPYGDHESREGLLVAHTLRGEGFDASEDGTGRGTPLVPIAFQTRGSNIDANGVITGTLGCNADRASGGAPCIAFHPTQDPISSADGTTHAMGCGSKGGQASVAVAFSCRDYGADAGDISPTLRAMGHSGSHANAGGQVAVAIPIQEAGKRTGVSTNDLRAGIGIGTDGEPMYTLQAGAQHAVAFAQNTRDEVRLIGGDGQIVGALAAEAGMKQQSYIAFDLRGREGGSQMEGPHDTASMRAASGGSSRSYLATPMAVRRITPEEAEKLQGFPPGYSAIPFRGKVAADGNRYRALGNSMAVPVMAWLGRRIDEAMS